MNSWSRGYSSTSPVVVYHSTLDRRGSIQGLPMTSITTDASLTGWVAHWLNQTAWVTWSLVEASHLSVGVVGCHTSIAGLSSTSEELQSNSPHRKYNGGGLCQSLRGIHSNTHKVVPADLGTSDALQGVEYTLTGILHSRDREM